MELYINGAYLNSFELRSTNSLTHGLNQFKYSIHHVINAKLKGLHAR